MSMDPVAAQQYVDQKLAAARDAVAAGDRQGFIDAVNAIAADAPVPATVRAQLGQDVWNSLIDNMSPRLQALLSTQAAQPGQEAGE